MRNTATPHYVWMLIRHTAIAVLAIVAIPFVVSSPSRTAFWVTMGAVALIMAPYIGVMAYFHMDIRRILRERKRVNP